MKFAALGDVVRTAYLLPALADKYPDARIFWLTSNRALEILRFNPNIYSLVTPTEGFDELKSLGFDFTVSLDDEHEVLEKVAELKTDRIIGARLEGGKRVYCEASAPWFDMGLISRFGKQRADELKKLNDREHHTFLEEMLGVRISWPSFFNSSLLEAKAKSLFERGLFHIGLNSGSGARWLSKQLPIEESIKLAHHLLAMRVDGKPVKIWLLGGTDEAQRHAEILSAFTDARVVDSDYNQSFGEFAARIKALNYLITSDSLALHLAISQDVPNLSFYAPTSAAEIGTFGTGIKVISTSPDYCSYKRDVETSSITTERILTGLKDHLMSLERSLTS